MFRPIRPRRFVPPQATCSAPVVCQTWNEGWPGLEDAVRSPGASFVYAQSSPGQSTLTRIIHESVGRNEQTLPAPELRSLFSDHSVARMLCRSTAFALFRQHVARPCSGLREYSGLLCRNCGRFCPIMLKTECDSDRFRLRCSGNTLRDLVPAYVNIPG